jgi:photosynthetic reaction center cytochrome c subunit
MSLKSIFISISVLVVFTLGSSATRTQTIDKPVEQVRKNIQVLKGLPDSQLFLLMNFVGDSLGVSCDYCHVKGEKNPQTGDDTFVWEKDDKKEKLAAREMMRMVLDLNQNRFKREGAVTCHTCHRGSTRPERMVPLPPRDLIKESLQTPQTQKKVLPTAQEVVAKYLSAVGAKQNAAIVMRGIVESRAISGILEVTFKQPNKALIKQTTASREVSTRVTNGVTAWIQTAKGVTEITGENFRRSIAAIGVYNPIKIPDSLNNATVTRIARVDDRDAYVLRMENSSTESIQFFFDVESGLLLRRVTVTNTMLGPLNVQWDFSDYRDVNGLKLPFVIRTSNVAPYDTTIRRFTEIKIDPALDDRIFDAPQTTSP